jgi:hypothetical protein
LPDDSEDRDDDEEELASVPPLLPRIDDEALPMPDNSVF